MTEKRFKPIIDGVEDTLTGEKLNNQFEVSLKLNSLNDENEQWKHDASILVHDASILVQANKDYRVENEQLKQQIKKLEAQLYKVEDGVCDICNNMYLVQQGRYFVSKCKKGHDECSKMDLDYCDDFELKDGDVE